MHQIRIRPDPAGELTALPQMSSPDPVAGFKGPTSKRTCNFPLVIASNYYGCISYRFRHIDAKSYN